MQEQQSGVNLIVLKGLEGHDATVLNSVQLLIYPYVPAMTVFWWCVWSLLFFRFIHCYLFSQPK